MESLAKLICGDYPQHKSIEKIYEVLFNNIKNMETRIERLLNEENDDITVLGPYYARNLLEASCTALIGRFDPFRLIYVHRIQSLESFMIGKKANGAISWFGDIFEKSTSGSVWDPDKDFSKIGRGLFGDHYGDVFWNPGFKLLIDDTTIEYGESLDYYRTKIEQPDKFTLYLRQRSSELYSSLSKGVHSELIVKPEIIFDKTTISELLIDVMKFCSIIGIVSHYIDFSICRLPKDNAFEYYITFYDWGESYYE